MLTEWSPEVREIVTRFKSGLYSIAMTFFPEFSQEYFDRNENIPYRAEMTNNPEDNSRNFILPLIASSLGYKLRHGMPVSTDDLFNTRTRYTSKHHKRIAPELAFDTITGEQADLLDWLHKRRPVLDFISLDHDWVDASNSDSLDAITESQESLVDRIRDFKEFVKGYYGLGGIVAWDISPHKGSSRRYVKPHIHAVIEPYWTGGRDWMNAYGALVEHWTRNSPRGYLAPDYNFKRVVRRRSHVNRVCRYTYGLTTIHGLGMPKILRYFDSTYLKSAKTDLADVGEFNRKPRQESTSNIAAQSRICRPDMHQLRLMIAFHVHGVRQFDRPFGGWSLKSALGKYLADKPRALRNSIKARARLSIKRGPTSV